MNHLKIKNLIIIFFVYLMVPMGFVLYIPSLEAIRKDFHTTTNMIDLTLSVYFAGVAISQLFYGSLSDKIGRKKTLYIGYAIFIIGSFLCVFATSINQFITYRILQGLGFGTDASVAAAILKDMYYNEEKLFAGSISFSQSVFGFATLIFPIIGGYLLLFLGWRANFVFMGIYTILIILAIRFFLTETNNPLNNKIKLEAKEYMRILSDYQYIAYLVALSLAGAVFPIFQIVGTVLLQVKLNSGPILISYFMTIVGLSYLIGAFFNAFLLQKVKIKRAVIILIIIFVLSIISMTITEFSIPYNFYNFLISNCIIFFACGGFFPNFMSGAMLRHPNYSGTCAGHVGFVAYLGGAIITYLISKINIENITQLITIYSVQIFLIIGLYFLAQKSKATFLKY